MSMSLFRQGLYALLALAGLIWTQILLHEFLLWNAGEYSITALLQFNWADFFASGFVNPGAAFLTVDAIIGVSAFLCWLVPEARRLGMRHWWVYILLTFGVAFAVAFPLFLLMRERALNAMHQGS